MGKNLGPEFPKALKIDSLNHVPILKPVTGAPGSSLEYTPPVGAGGSSALLEPCALGVGKTSKEVSRSFSQKERNDHRQATQIYLILVSTNSL